MSEKPGDELRTFMQWMLEDFTAEQIMFLLAHKLKMQDKTLAVFPVENDSMEGYFMLPSTETEPKDSAVIIYNGGE